MFKSKNKKYNKTSRFEGNRVVKALKKHFFSKWKDFTFLVRTSRMNFPAILFKPFYYFFRYVIFIVTCLRG